MMTEKRKWIRRPLVQWDARGKVTTHGKHKPVRIGIHTTECHDAAGIREMHGVVGYWQRQSQALGAHVLIDKDGNSALCANFDRITWAIKNGNTGTIHFELIGFARFVPRVWWTRLKQLNKLARWIAYLNLEYGIPMEHSTIKGVAGHREFPGNDHTDPGVGFPMRWVIRRAKQYRANGWT